MTALPCIRCGDCALVCPAQLQPQYLLLQLLAGRPAQAEAAGLFDCSECGRCDPVCPSHIALAATFAAAKTDIAERKHARAQADAARAHYLARTRRLARDAAERRERDAARKHDLTSADAVAAAIERAKARRRPGGDGPP